MQKDSSVKKTGRRKIFFSDIDETLVTTDKKLTPANREAIDRFVREGNLFAISTGRALSGAIHLMKSIGLYEEPNTYISSFNGGLVYDLRAGKTLFRIGLDSRQVRIINDCARSFGIHIHAYTDTAVLTETDNENLRRYCALQSLPWKIVPDLADAIEGSTCKLLAIDYSSPSRVESFRSLVDRIKEEAGVDAFQSNEWLLEVVPKGINKGRALTFLADYLSVPIENTISVGDEENDIPMIRAAGTGCAMANGIQSVKDAADYVTQADNNHSAIAEILEKFG